MTLYEALQDMGKGRIIDNGCNYELIALAKGVYTFHIWETGEDIEIKLAGTPKENAEEIERQFNNRVQPFYQGSITKASYRK